MPDVEPDPTLDRVQTLLQQRWEELTHELERLARKRETIAKMLSEMGVEVTGWAGPPRPIEPQTPRPSVRTMVVNLLNEDDRDWNAADILAAFERRGTPVQAVDPSNAVRAALNDANKSGQIFRIAVGRYKSTKWKPSESTPMPEDLRMDDDRGEVVP